MDVLGQESDPERHSSMVQSSWLGFLFATLTSANKHREIVFFTVQPFDNWWKCSCRITLLEKTDKKQIKVAKLEIPSI